jgi:hypothetical protein
MKLQPLVDGRAARTATGNAIAVIEVRRPAGSDHGEVTIEVRQDFAIVQQAVDRLVSGPQAAALFAPAPFPREPLFAALFGELGMAGARGGTGCCQAARALPPPQLEVPAVAPVEPAAAATPGQRPPATRRSAASSPTAPPVTRRPRLSRRIFSRAARPKWSPDCATARRGSTFAWRWPTWPPNSAKRRRCHRKVCCRLSPAPRKPGAAARCGRRCWRRWRAGCAPKPASVRSSVAAERGL